MKAESDFFTHREWLVYQKEQEEKKRQINSVETLSLKEVNLLLKEDKYNPDAIKRRRQLIQQYKNRRVTQVNKEKQSVIEKIKNKIKGEK